MRTCLPAAQGSPGGLEVAVVRRGDADGIDTRSKQINDRIGASEILKWPETRLRVGEIPGSRGCRCGMRAATSATATGPVWGVKSGHRAAASKNGR